MKRGKILLVAFMLSLMLFLPLIFSAEEDHVQEGYDCLEGLIQSRGCSSLTLQEQVFSSLAARECKDEIKNSMNANNCWPGSGCNIKSTAQAIFALAERGENTDAAEEWLLARTRAAQGLEWFLQVDIPSGEPSTCTVKYDNLVFPFNIDSDRKLTSPGGDCLVLTTDNPYWFRINPSCYEKEFRITCNDDDFLTTLLFKKQDSNTINVMSQIHSAAEDGETKEIVSARCFTTGTSCDYEGTLWATMVLWSERRDVKPYIPYLIAMEDGNERFLPESFLYLMTGKFLPKLLDKQKHNSYWEVSGNRYYDTAMALFPMYGQTNYQKTYAKDYLLNNQDPSGCFHGNNIVDTGFILYSLWPLQRPECRSNNDCIAPYLCNITTNFCYNPGIPPVGDECEDNEDCTSPEICNLNTGRCYNPGPTPECERDRDCNWIAGEKCSEEGICYNPDDSECGNSVIEPGEQCDGTRLGGKTCSDILQGTGWSGSLSCIPAGQTHECKFDTSECKQEQECEDDDECPGEQVCNSEGYCIDSTKEPYCGNKVKEDGEQCDGYDYNGQTCGTIFGSGWSGSLHCSDKCVIDTSDCKESKECTWNWNCPGDQVCQSGKCVNPPPPPSKDCTSDSQCTGDQTCVNGKCVPPEPECGLLKPCPGTKKCENGVCVPECTSDWDCPGDELCENEVCIEPNATECNWDWNCPGDKKCVDNFCKDPENKTGVCIYDVDCPHPNEICEDGACINSTTNKTDECDSDWDCPGSDICVNGSCFVQNVTCTSDWQCPGEQECVSGNCLEPSPNNSVKTCVSDYDCPGTKICVDGYCSDNSGEKCTDKGYFCMASTLCTGNIYPSYTCSYPFQCCDEELPLESCFQQNGEICLQGESCVGGVQSDASDLETGQVCCTGGGYCLKKQEVSCESDEECKGENEICVSGFCEEQYADYCEDHNGHCRPTKCNDGEKQSYIYECNYGDICCVEDGKAKGSGVGLIIVLLILIALVVAGIVFRDKLKVYWLKVKSKFDKGGKSPRRPGMPPYSTKTKESFIDKIKAFFTGKKNVPVSSSSQRGMPPRPLRGPLAVQQAQRQAPKMPEPIKPSPIKSTSTPFSQTRPGADKLKKSPKSNSELDEVLEKLKKMSNK